MPTFLSYAIKVLWMENRVSACIQGTEGIPFFRAIAKPLQTRRRIISLCNRIPSCCQRSLGQRGGRGAKIHILHKPSTLRCGKEIPSYGKASLCPGNRSSQTWALLSSAHGGCSDEQTFTKSDEQPWSSRMNGTMGDQIERIRNTISPTHGHKRPSYCWLHRRIHLHRRLRGRRESSMEYPHRQIVHQTSKRGWCGIP